MGAQKYFGLIASLPWLPYFERAERLPINRQRLEKRLGSLRPDDARALFLAEDFLVWQRAVPMESDKDVAGRYGGVLREISQPGLKKYVKYCIEQRTIIAALRRQRLGLGPPGDGEIWGIGDRVLWIESRWDTPDFGLERVYPWIPEAREYITGENAKGLERLLTDIQWTILSRGVESDPFGFDEVFGYLFKWNLLNQWLSYDADSATERFKDLILEVINEQEEIISN